MRRSRKPRKNYRCLLLSDDDLSICRFETDNLRDAVRDTYRLLSGCPGASATIKAGGVTLFEFTTDGGGAVDDIQFLRKVPVRTQPGVVSYRVVEVVHVNPYWVGWGELLKRGATAV